MEQSELLRHLVGKLEELGFRYLVTGSVVTIFFGEPRFTNDIDVVLDLPADCITEFCSAFSTAEFYLSEDAVRQAVKQHGQFNLIHPESGLKVDFMIPEDSAFNRSRFARATRVRFAEDCDATFASVEDVIIKKMEYYRQGRSEKHLRDIAAVLKISGQQIDRSYISDWASELGLSSIWQAVLDRQASSS